MPIISFFMLAFIISFSAGDGKKLGPREEKNLLASLSFDDVASCNRNLHDGRGTLEHFCFAEGKQVVGETRTVVKFPRVSTKAGGEMGMGMER